MPDEHPMFELQDPRLTILKITESARVLVVLGLVVKGG